LAYRATVIPVMIASPGDVSEERDVIRTVIHDWNDVNASASQVMLSPVGWDTHSSPELGARPQELINSRLLRDCDLLVGVFWTRLGTPTGKAKSGTVEEIEEHVSAGRPAMIYFSSKPVAPESINSRQFAELQAFKERLKPLGLVESFDTVDEFRAKFTKQLQLALINNPYLRSVIQVSVESEDRAEHVSADDHAGASALSQEAQTLLKTAAERENGTILKLAFVGGRVIQAGGQKFGGERGREAAKWENALEELEVKGLVVARGYKGEVYELTHAGWQLADVL
jgi:hypothetical protein